MNDRISRVQIDLGFFTLVQCATSRSTFDADIDRLSIWRNICILLEESPDVRQYISETSNNPELLI